MMRAMYSGVAGLKTHQTKMDVIGNNIANVNTTSYKSQSITFSDLMYQTTQTASGATETKGGVNARQIGLGAKSGAINTAITTQGTSQTTNNPFDIMITGQSFFVVNNGKENLYTRDGSFYVDGAGNLAMQANGYLVQGWVAQEDRETGAITVNKNGGLSALQIMSPANYTYSPASTTSALFSDNIDSADTNLISNEGKTITLEFYDNKGYLYTGKFTLKNTEPAENHMFALTLTDIIDSNGKSINDNGNKYDLMSQITFGNTENANRVTKSEAVTGYSFVAGTDASHITINKDTGDVKYDGVSAKGDLATLLNSKKGLLEKVYGLSELGLQGLYGDGYLKATYTIAGNGDLTISSPVENVPQTSYNTSKYKVDFSTPNTAQYFINASSQAAYKVPAANGNASDLTSGFLSDVFEITDDYSSGFNYKYTPGKISIYKDVPNNLIGENKPVTSLLVNDTFEYMADKGGINLSTLLTNMAPDGDYSNFKYTLTSDGTITITQKVEGISDTDATVSLGNDLTAYENDIATMAVKLGKVIGSSGASKVTYSQIKGVIDDNTGKYTDEEKLAASAIKDELDAAFGNLQNSTVTVDGISFKLTNLTGTNGLTIFYKTNVIEEKPFPDATTTFTSFPVVDNKAATVKFKNITTPKYVYQNSNDTYGKSYFLSEDALTRSITYSTINADFLKEVFHKADINSLVAEMNQNRSREYSMVIDPTNGWLTISHTEVDSEPHAIVNGNEYKATTSEGKVTYTSTSAYKNVPVKGNISKLLESLSGSDNADYEKLLSKVYGISDAQARAFGVDGTYEINTTPGTGYGNISLTVGNHTIQLAFDAANGSIVSADGDKVGKTANITFGQGLPGLEAFGFQASATNAAEQDRAFTISVDFSNLSNYNTNGSSTIKATKGDIHSLNTGRAVGEMNGVSVSTDGQIFAKYSNGQTKLLGQIASAEFANASGLSKEGDNLYASTLNSGEATIQDITTDGGYMNTGVLEMSNVDLSSEFTEMITTQRGFQANSRIITVSDTLLEELTNLKR